MTTPQLRCDSRIVKVDVYARGAIVTRDVTLPEHLPDAELELLIGGIPLQADPGSLQAAVDGGREIVGLASVVHLPQTGTNPAELELQLRDLERDAQRLRLRRSELQQERQQLAALQPQPHHKPKQKRKNLAWIDDALALSALSIDLLNATDEALIGLDAELVDVDRRIAAARLALHQARAAQTVDPDQATRLLVLRLGPHRTDARCLGRVTVAYAVAAARWWPAYTARLSQGGTRAEWTLEAFVAHKSDEDWDGVALTLCTADLTRDVQLPELRTLRIGRAQRPRPSGYRSPPQGLDALFTNYDRAFGAAPAPQPPPPPTQPMSTGALMPQADLTPSEAFYPDEAQDLDEGASDLKAYANAAAPMPHLPPGMPAPQAAPAPVRAGFGGGFMPQSLSRGAAPETKKESAKGRRLREEPEDAPAHRAAAPRTELPGEIEPEAGWLDFDQLSMGSGDSRAVRGRLQPLRSRAGDQRRQAALQHITATTTTPHLARDPLQTRGQFDHRYLADGRVELPGDGHAHRITVSRATTTSRTAFRTLPRLEETVYREVKLDNPFPSPLLAGPVEVFVDGALVITSAIDSVDRGGAILFGLGVEERLRVARNTTVQESSQGLFKGTVAVVHEVEFELSSTLGFPAPITVVDRTPTTLDDDIEIDLLDASPAPEPYDQRERGNPIKGGLRWELLLDPGASTTLRFSYQVKFPAKYELHGGNRRE